MIFLLIFRYNTKVFQEATETLKFNMASDLYTGSLLKTLVASKPPADFFELGTGTGLATSWILTGMDKKSFDYC